MWLGFITREVVLMFSGQGRVGGNDDGVVTEFVRHFRDTLV
jgi:hypothetical protein